MGIYQHSGLLLLVATLSCDAEVAGDSAPADAQVLDAQGVGEDASPGCVAEVADTFYADSDGDGYGTPDLTAVDCVQPAGFVVNNLDCDDGDSRINPDGTELCDGLDNDCNPATIETCSSGCTVHTKGPAIYLFCDTPANQANATQVCQGEDMHLVRIDDQAEQAYLSEERIVAFGGRAKTFIGATDLGVENKWLWQDDTHFWQGRADGAAVGGLFSYWGGGEPNDSGTEDCAGMRNNDSSTGRWVDFECSQVVRFICERDIVAP